MFIHKNATEHGIDISKSRLDDIDRAVIAFALSYKGKKVAVDIGCGSGRVSIILALMGFEMWLYDIQDLADYFSRVGEALGISDKLHFVQGDIVTSLTSHNIKAGEKGESEGSHESFIQSLPKDIVIAISQRTLHHMPHSVAKTILEKVAQKIIPNGKIFFSVSGIDCGFAKDYPCKDEPIENRFCTLQKSEITDFYGINDSVCLYKKQEVQDIVQNARLSIESIQESMFGNFKVIATNTIPNKPLLRNVPFLSLILKKWFKISRYSLPSFLHDKQK